MNIQEIKKDIYELIQLGDLTDNSFKKLFINKHSIIGKECELWDFKENFDGTKEAYLKLLKAIASFYNSYGGYIFYGVKEVIKDTSMKVIGVNQNIIDNQKLRGQFDKFFGRRIDLTYFEIKHDVDDAKLNVGILYIPKRGVQDSPLTPISDGVGSGNERILSKDFIFIRRDDQCKSAVSLDDFKFVSGERIPTYVVIQTIVRKKIIEHNLPDKNQICPIFIGRMEIIQELWSWLSNDLQYTKVIAADGGKGKTSVAYEFCRLIVESGSELFDQIIWLTAKSKQFKAIYNSYIDTPEIHYSDVETLLSEICIRTGSLPDETAELNYLQLQRLAKENLQIYRYLIVVDDVDSNVPDEQRRIMEIARVISNSSSRVLLTTRVNNMYSSDSAIILPGLSGEEYKTLIQEHCRNLHLQPFNDKNTYKLQEVSEGSPLFTESILRLCKLGLSLDDAINEWKGKSGDAVRVAALRKEVKELSQEAIKILITISVVGTCSRTELRQYTDLENHDLERAMEDLGNLFLIKSIGFIESEPRFETSSSISKLVISIGDEILPNAEAFIAQVNEISVGLSDNAKLKSNNSEVGKVIRQCNSLIKEQRFDEARKIIKDILKKTRFKENSDIYFMAAKIQYEDNEAKPESVRKSFVEAYVKGQKKPFFFEMWYQTEMKFGTANSIHDVCTNALKNISSNDYQWCERYVYACHELARNAKSDTIELKYLVMGYEYVNSLIKNSKPPKKTEFIHLSRTLVDKIWELSIAIGKYEISVVIIMNAINFGDIRSATFNKLLDSANMILSKTSLNTEVAKHKNDLINSIQKAVHFLRECNPPRPELAEKLNIALGLLIESVTD